MYQVQPIVSKTNQITKEILEFLLKQRIFAWRENTAPIPLPDGKGYRSSGLSGKPDIIAISHGGIFIGIEVKYLKDKLRPAQVSFHIQAQELGAIMLVVKDFDDFMNQWNKL